MARGLTSNWGVSARSAFVAATVVIVALGIAGAGLAIILYRTMLSGIDSAAANRVGDLATRIVTDGVAGVDDAMLQTDERIVAIQVIAPDGTVVRRSQASPDTALIPMNQVGDGLRIGMPEQSSPFGRIRFSAQTVAGPDGRYTVLVGEGSATVASTVWTVVTALAIAAPIVVTVSAGATYLLVRRSLRSVDEIRSRVADITTSDLTGRVPVPGGRDEIAALAVTMNEMLARIESGHDAQRRFVGDASHELRSPLTTIISALEVAVTHPELLDESLARTTLLPEALRMKSLIDDLLLLARADERGLDMAMEDVDLDDLVGSEVERLRLDTDRAVELDAEPVRSTGDAGALTRAVRNLLDNAARHATSRIEVVLRQDSGRALLEVRDDGAGIPAPQREHVFGRFVRLDPDRSRSAGGAGLGLGIVREIIVAHGGTVTIGDIGGSGTRVTVHLPLATTPDSRR